MQTFVFNTDNISKLPPGIILPKELDIILLKNKSDKKRLDLCSNKIKEIIKFINKYNDYLCYNDKKTLADIITSTQDKYLSVLVHYIMDNNYYWKFYELLYEQDIIAYKVNNFDIHYYHNSGLLKFCKLQLKTTKFIKMNQKVYAYSKFSATPFYMEDELVNIISDTLSGFYKKKDYYQGGYYCYLYTAINNKLQDFCNKIDSNNKKLFDKKNKHRTYLTDEEISIKYNDASKIKFSSYFVNKYHLDELLDRQIIILKMYYQVEVDKYLTNDSLCKIFNTSISTIKRDKKLIINHLSQFL